MRGRWTYAISGVLMLALAAGYFSWYGRSHAAHAKVAAATPPAIPVAASEITLTGTIHAARVVIVPVPVDGTVEQFMAEVGQHVSEGEVLARIRNPRLAAAEQAAKLDADQAQNHLSQLESALIAARLEVSRSEADAIRVKSELGQAEKTFERQQIMFREGVASRLSYEKAEQEYNSLKAASQKLAETAQKAAERVDSTSRELDPSRKTLAQRTSDLEDAQAESAMGEVDSLANGAIILRRGKLGQPVTPAMPDLFQIAVDPLVLEAVANIQPQIAARMQPGHTAAVQIAGTPSPMAATIREVKSGEIFITITNPSPGIALGMTVQIRIK